MNPCYILLLTKGIEGLNKGYIPSGTSEKEWKQLYYNKLWLGENDLTAVTVT